MARTPFRSFFSYRKVIELLLLLVGLVCTFLATWVFYLGQWLHLSVSFDPWLERNRCLIEFLCNSNWLMAHPLGVLFTIGALVAFSLAMWMEHRMPERWKTAMDTRQLLFTRVTLLALIVGSLILQVIQLLIEKTPPSGGIWLVGVFGLVGFGIALDARLPGLDKTLANLAAALGMMAMLLGAAGVILRTQNLLVAVTLFVVGMIVFAAGSRWATERGSSFSQTDRLLMVLLAFAHLALALIQVWSWRFAFIGDEWGFFEIARALNHGATELNWFEMRDSNGFHSVLSMQFQAWVMALFGENVAVWRLSSILPGVYAVPAVYVLGHWLGGQRAAVLGAGAFAVSHAILCFAMIPYNNTQAIFPLAVSAALFVFAIQRENSLRYLLIGMVLGLGFIVYGLARLAVIPVGIFWIFYQWPNLRVALRRAVEMGSGLLVVAAPILLNLASWQSLLKATPVQSEVSPEELSLTAQIVRNVISGLLAFLTNPSNTHFVIGPYVDPLTAVFVLIGLAYLLVTLGRQRSSAAWLIGAILLLVAMSGIQQYSRIATTRMFSSVFVLAVFAGIGGAALLRLVLPRIRWVQYGSVGALLIVMALINQYHIYNVTFPHSEKPNIPLIVQQFQETAAADGPGMPVFVIDNDPFNSILKLVLQAYDVGSERMMLVTEEEALQLPYVCDAGQAEAILIVPVNMSRSQEIQNRIADCWPGYERMALQNRADEITLYRFTSAAALSAADAARGRGQSDLPVLAAADIRALATAPDGSTFVLSSAERRVIHYSAEGRRLHSFGVEQENPIGIVVDGQGRIVVAGGDQKLVWYDARGDVIQSTSARRDLFRPFGLAVIGDELLVSDLERRQFARISAQGDLIETFAVPGIEWPAALVAAADQQSVWVYDAQPGMITAFSWPDRSILQQVRAYQSGAPEEVALALLPNQNILQSIPHQRRLIETNLSDQIVRTWSGFDQPTALAVNAMDQILVLERRLEEVHILPAAYPVPSAATNADRDRPQIGSQPRSSESPLSPVSTPSP